MLTRLEITHRLRGGARHQAQDQVWVKLWNQVRAQVEDQVWVQIRAEVLVKKA